MKGKVKHVLVCGHITANKARDFCQEFFHEDHGMSDAHIVFLCPELPDGQMEMLAHSRSHQITYLQVGFCPTFEDPDAHGDRCRVPIACANCFQRKPCPLTLHHRSLGRGPRSLGLTSRGLKPSSARL